MEVVPLFKIAETKKHQCELIHLKEKFIQINPYQLLYFFGYKTELFSFANNTKNLDPSDKMDLDIWHCSERVKLVL